MGESISSCGTRAWLKTKNPSLKRGEARFRDGRLETANLRGRGGLLAMARGERRGLSGSVAEVRQARCPRNDHQQDGGDRLRARLWLGRRAAGPTGRTLLQDPVHAAPA